MAIFLQRQTSCQWMGIAETAKVLWRQRITRGGIYACVHRYLAGMMTSMRFVACYQYRCVRTSEETCATVGVGVRLEKRLLSVGPSSLSPPPPIGALQSTAARPLLKWRERAARNSCRRLWALPPVWLLLLLLLGEGRTPNSSPGNQKLRKEPLLCPSRQSSSRRRRC